MKEETISQYNEALLQIKRLHSIWMSCRLHRESGYLEEYRWDLKSAEIELKFDANKLTKEENRDFTEELKEINEKINVAFKENKEEEEILDKNKAFDVLIQKELLLREIQEKSGKGSLWKDVREDELD